MCVITSYTFDFLVQSPTFAMPTPPSAGVDWTTTTNPVGSFY